MCCQTVVKILSIAINTLSNLLLNSPPWSDEITLGNPNFINNCKSEVVEVVYIILGP